MAEKLFASFPPVSTQEWEDVIKRDLKGAVYEKKLIWHSPEGFNVLPYYRAEDLTDLPYLDSEPGQFPFLRGNSARQSWLIRQNICAFKEKEWSAANQKAREALRGGATSLGFYINGETAFSPELIAILLQDIDLWKTEINFTNCGSSTPGLIKAFIKYAEGQGYDTKRLSASFDFDPLRKLNATARFDTPHPELAVREVYDAARDCPLLRCIGVSGLTLQNAGAGIVQELACSLAMAAEYMDMLTRGNDTDLNRAAKAIKFNLGVGSNYFMEIAKFRAGRVLWASICKTWGVTDPEAQKMMVHAVTSERNQTVYDRYVNMLRGTTETMSAALGGVHSIEITPFDKALDRSTAFGDRMARNTQIILKEEAYFDRVSDPAGGSYYVEKLTASIAKAAWESFREIEKEKGYIHAFMQNKIQEAIENSAHTTAKNLSTRRQVLVGTNQYPDFKEKADPEYKASLSAAPNQETDTAPEGPRPLRPVRFALPFEKLRSAVEQSGKTPKAFMLTFGNLSMCRARSQFASNFFAVAGIEIIDNNCFANLEEGVKAALLSKADICVACSSDEEYAEALPQIAKLIARDKTDDIRPLLIVAGEPPCKQELIEQGITRFISIRSNVLETLSQYLKALGIF